MQESIQAAKSYVQSRAASLGILPPMFYKRDIHVHVLAQQMLALR